MLKIRWTPSKEYESNKCKTWVTALYIIGLPNFKKINVHVGLHFLCTFSPALHVCKTETINPYIYIYAHCKPFRKIKFNFSFVQYCYLSIIVIRFISFRLSQISVVFLSVYPRYTRGIIAYKQDLYLFIPGFYMTMFFFKTFHLSFKSSAY